MAKQTAAEKAAEAAVANLLPALLAAMQSGAVVAAEAEPETKQDKSGPKAVKDENAGEAPTSKQVYLLVMEARRVGLATFSCDSTRGAIADRIGKVKAASTKAAKVKALTA